MLLEASNLSKEFLRGQQSIMAVNKVELRVDAGDFVSITGRSGSGKSTLLTLLLGLLSPTGGQVLFRGTDIHALPDRELSVLRNRDMAFVPQGAGLLGNFNVLDNVRMPQVFAHGQLADSGRALFLLEEMGLARLKDEYPANLSGGEIRRVAIARALFNRPCLLMADEPTSDLDPENSQLVMRLLQNCNEHGTAVILVTHEEEFAGFGKTRLAMKEGRLAPLLA